MEGSNTPPARKPFRYIAAFLAIVCFILAAVFAWFDDDNWQVSTRICAYVGLVMLAIAATGRWGKR